MLVPFGHPPGQRSGDAPAGLTGLDEGVRITGGRCHSIEHHRYEDERANGARHWYRYPLWGCITYHTKMAHQHGATKPEILEIVALAVLHGRPAGSRLLCRSGACI